MYERKEKQLKEEKEWFYNKDNHTMKPPNTFELPLVLLNWEDKIIWDDSDSKDTSTLSSITNSDFK